MLRQLVAQLRAAWPGVAISVRGDNGLAVPDWYDSCEEAKVSHAFGYASNSVLQARTDAWLADLETYYHWYQHCEPHVQRCEDVTDYQAGSWPHARRVVAKLESNRHGTNRRFVVTNRPEAAQALYQDFYVQRGRVPERPIGALKNGLHADRLSLHHFRANAFKLLEHVLAYALVVLHREAPAALPTVAKAEVSTLRTRLGKVAAVVRTSVRRVWIHLSATWPYQELWWAVQAGLQQFVAAVRAAQRVVPGSAAAPLL